MKIDQKISRRLAQLSNLAPSGYAIGLHFRHAVPHLDFKTYDPEWVKLYMESGFMLADPVVYWGFGDGTTIRWSELNLPDPHKIFEKAERYGLKYGAIVAVGPMKSRTIAGFSRPDREFTDAEIDKLHTLVEELHVIATPPEILTKAQRAALQHVAKGHRYAEAAALLGISESALKARLRSARDRLAARTTAEAIQRAQERRML